MERGGSIENKTLLYSRVADRIYQYIKEENLQPGEKLPGERKLAEEWKVSRSTLREAIRELEVDAFPAIVVVDSNGRNLYEEVVGKYRL